MSVPNQKIVKIHKHSYTSDFLQIGKDEWMEAYQILTPSAFAFYLYLAGNADGFLLELSKEAVKNAIGISKATYHRCVSELIEKGYLHPMYGNRLSFETSRKNETPYEYHDWDSEVSEMIQDSFTDETSESQIWNQVVSEMNTEIDKIDNIDNKDKINKVLNLEGKYYDLIMFTRKNYPEIDYEFCNRTENLAFFNEEQSVAELKEIYLKYGIQLDWIKSA